MAANRPGEPRPKPKVPAKTPVKPTGKAPPPFTGPTMAPTRSITSPGRLDRSDIAALGTYIKRLSAVKNPSAKQTAKLATYKARKVSYAKRLAGAKLQSRPAGKG